MKLYVWKASVIADLNLPKVTDLIAFQKVDYFLQLAQNYNEDLIRIFYSGLHGRKGPYFKFTIGNVVYQFNKQGEG